MAASLGIASSRSTYVRGPMAGICRRDRTKLAAASPDYVAPAGTSTVRTGGSTSGPHSRRILLDGSTRSPVAGPPRIQPWGHQMQVGQTDSRRTGVFLLFPRQVRPLPEHDWTWQPARVSRS